MKNAKYYNSHNVPLSLTNLYYGNQCSVTAIEDVVEDSHTAIELKNGLNNLKIFEKFKIDRVTDSYVRLKSVDKLGNVHYFKAEFDKKPVHRLKDYYDTMSDNYIIPIEDMTKELMDEALALLKECPWNNAPHTYAMFLWNDGEGDNWYITSWLE